MAQEAVVLFDYDKNQDDELDLRAGTVILNVTQVDDGWCEGTLDGKTGMFPDNFVKLRPAVTPSPAVMATSKPPPPNPTPSEPPVITRPAAQKVKTKRAKVAFSYIADNSDEMSLEPGEIMEVLGEAEDGWWRGRMGTRTGLFPSNFVELIEEEATPTTVAPLESSHATAHITTDGAPQLPPDKPRVGTGMGLPRFNPADVKLKSVAASHPPPPAKDREPPKPPDMRKPLPPKTVASVGKPPALPPQETAALEKAKVVFEYTSEKEDELTIKPEDILEVLDKKSHDGWWEVKLNGKKGLVPDNFVELITSQPEPAESPAKKEHRRPPPAPVVQETPSEKSDFGVPPTEPLDSSAMKDRAQRPVGTVRPPSRSNLHQDENEPPAPAEDGGQAPWQKELKQRKKKEPVKLPPVKTSSALDLDKKPIPPRLAKPPPGGDKPRPRPPATKPTVDAVKPTVSSSPHHHPTPPSPSSITKPPSKPSDTGPAPPTPPQSSDAWEEALEKLREEFAEFKVHIRKEIKTLSADLDEERKKNASLRIDIDRLKKTVL